MLFSSMIFIWIFLPTVLIVNFILSIANFPNEEKRMRVKNIFLLFSSFIFLGWGGIYYLLIMLTSIGINFCGGYYLSTSKKEHKKILLIGVIILNLGMLFIFKYFNFLVVIIESFMNIGNDSETIWKSMLLMEGTGKLGIKEIALPIGISFFTFQSMSYVIDVYMGKAKVQKNLIDFALYVALFPQLIAGPIVKYSDVAKQLKHRQETMLLFLEGTKRFCYGLAKKVLLSNTFAEIADEIWELNIDKLGAPLAWLATIAYTLQIYYDFSGYSDMAIGIGKMLGFQFKENFNYPYTALSIQDFWRRWHISLSSWFKEYVYIPLGGNRKGQFKTYINLFIVFLLTGIWHGANFTFIAWGLIYAILLIIERMFLGKLLEKNPLKFLNWIYTIFAVMICWIFFRSDNIIQATKFIKQLFSTNTSAYSILSYTSMKTIVFFILGILFMGIFQRLLKSKYDKVKNKPLILSIDFVIQIALLTLSIFSIVSGTYNPFIYFQF